MKYLNYIIIIFSLILCSCDNYEPDSEIELPITTAFIPFSIEIDLNDMDEMQREQINYLTTRAHIVNNILELPEDPIGQNETFKKINYQDNTLLILYIMHYWAIDTYSNRFYRYTKDNTYNWIVKLGTLSEGNNKPDKILLTRFAILVKKLPENAELKTWYSHTSVDGITSDLK